MKKVCLVTGGSNGLGLELCKGMLMRGFRVINIDIEDPEEKMGEFLSEGDDYHYFEADTTCEEELKEAKEEIESLVAQKIDVLVNNASANDVCWFEDLSTEDFMRIIDVNIKGYFLVTKTFLPMVKRGEGEGAIVNIASHSAWKPMTAETAYNMSKAAQLMMAKQLAREFSKLDYGTTVFALSPNKMEGTPMSEKLDRKAAHVRGWSFKENRKKQVDKLLAKEETDPKVVADVLCYILENKKRHKYLTGCNLEFGE